MDVRRVHAEEPGIGVALRGVRAVAILAGRARGVKAHGVRHRRLMIRREGV